MYSTEGIILNKVGSGEADALYVIYTKDFGKIRALAQGVKKEGAKLSGHLELLSQSRISFVLGKNGERLTQASLVNFWPAIRADYEKLSAACRIAELMDKYCLTGEKDGSLWNLLVGSFKELEKNKFSPEFLNRFEKAFLASLGYGGVSDIAHLEYN